MSDIGNCSSYSWLCGIFEGKTCFPFMFVTVSSGLQIVTDDLFLFEDSCIGDLLDPLKPHLTTLDCIPCMFSMSSKSKGGQQS